MFMMRVEDWPEEVKAAYVTPYLGYEDYKLREYWMWPTLKRMYGLKEGKWHYLRNVTAMGSLGIMAFHYLKGQCPPQVTKIADRG